MNYQTIDYAVDDAVGTLTFARPDQLNAMNRLMMEEIVHALGALATDPAVRVGVITGAGRAFMAGADIKEYARQTQAEFEAFQTLGASLYALIEEAPKPVIAAVNGMAFGGGFEIALACDLAVAAAGAKFGLPEVNLNLIPGGGGTQRLPRRIGLSRANELLLSGRAATAEELLEWGFVNAVYPREAFAADARVYARQFATKSPDALRALKQLARRAVGAADATALADEREELARLYRTEAAQAAIQGFYQQSVERARAKAAKTP